MRHLPRRLPRPRPHARRSQNPAPPPIPHSNAASPISPRPGGQLSLHYRRVRSLCAPRTELPGPEKLAEAFFDQRIESARERAVDMCLVPQVEERVPPLVCPVREVVCSVFDEPGKRVEPPVVIARRMRRFGMKGNMRLEIGRVRRRPVPQPSILVLVLGFSQCTSVFALLERAAAPLEIGRSSEDGALAAGERLLVFVELPRAVRESG